MSVKLDDDVFCGERRVSVTLEPKVIDVFCGERRVSVTLEPKVIDVICGERRMRR